MTQIHLHTTFVSYNRPELLQRAYVSYKETVSLPHSVVIVDNGSDEATLDWLTGGHIDPADRVCLLGENRYPGYATNFGWAQMPTDTALLHRADNDFVYLPHWCETVIRCFFNPWVGQVGLRTDTEELSNTNNVGGNNVIRRTLYELGLRYDERPWREYPTGWTEDSYFSPEVERMGWDWIRVPTPCIVPISTEDPADPYYQQTWAERGITPR